MVAKGSKLASAWHCRAMALPWRCHVVAVAVPLSCHGSNATPVPRHSHGSARAVSWQCVGPGGLRPGIGRGGACRPRRRCRTREGSTTPGTAAATPLALREGLATPGKSGKAKPSMAEASKQGCFDLQSALAEPSAVKPHRDEPNKAGGTPFPCQICSQSAFTILFLMLFAGCVSSALTSLPVQPTASERKLSLAGP